MALSTRLFDEQSKLTLGIKERLLRAHKSSIFPNTTVKGTYDFWSQVIILQSLEEQNILALQSAAAKGDTSETLHRAKDIFPLICHEYTHWLDNTSTLWGLEMICNVYSSYQTWIIENKSGAFNEKEYHLKKSLADKMKLISFPKYYTTLTTAENCYPWHFTYSMGKLFTKEGRISSYPLFFTRFSNQKGEQIARQPFSLAAVLETSATAQEFAATSALIVSMAKGDEIFVEQKLFKDEVLNTIYEPELTVYSVAAHHVANSFRITDVLEAYKISTILARFVLNFPDEMFSLIEANSVYGEGNIFSEGFKTALDHKDRGTLFFFIIALLSKNYEGQTVKSADFEKMVIDALAKFGIRYDELKSTVDSKMKQLTLQMAKFGIPYLLSLSVNSACNYQRLGLFGKPAYDFDDLKMPGVLLGDDTFFNPNGAKDDSICDRYLALDDFSDSIYQFSDACISIA